MASKNQLSEKQNSKSSKNQGTTMKSKKTTKRKLSSKGKDIIRKSIAGVLVASGLIVAAIPEDRSGVAMADTSGVINMNEQVSPLSYDADSTETRNGEFKFPYANANALDKTGQTVYTSFVIDNSTGRARLIPDFEYFIPDGGIDGKNVGVTSRFCNQDTKSLEFDGVIVTGYEMITAKEYKDWWTAHDFPMGFTSILPTDNQISAVKEYFGDDNDFIDWETKYKAALVTYSENHPEGPVAQTFEDIGMGNNIFSKSASQMPEAKKYLYYCDQNDMKGFTLVLVSNLVPGRTYLLNSDANNPSNNVADVMPTDAEIYVSRMIDPLDPNIPDNIKQKCDANGYRIKAYQNIEAIGNGTFAKNAQGEEGQYYSELKSIVFKGNIKYIGDSAFEGSSIEHVEIPSVKYIGNYVFKDCTNLNSIEFNPDTQYIGKEAFYGCKKIKQLVMPGSRLEIGFGAFAGLTELNSVDFNQSQNAGANIGEYAFFNCVNLNSVTFYPFSEYGFGKAAFALPAGSGTGSSISAASPMTRFEFPQIEKYHSLTDSSFDGYTIYDENQDSHPSEIGDYMFANRSDLDSLKMPPDFGNENPQWIPMNTLDNCRNLGLLEFDEKNNSYVYYDRNLFEDVENTKLRVFGPQSKFYTDNLNNSTAANPRYSTWHATTYALDYVPYVYRDSNGVEHYEVGKGEYRYELQINNDNVTASIISCELINQPSNPNTYVFDEDFIIPGQVADYNITELADNSLNGVKNYIKKLIIADDSIQFIDDDVFSYAKNLEEVVMGNSVMTLGNRAFADCPKLEKVTIGENIETLGEEVFANDSNLEHVYWTVPAEPYISSIGQNAFRTNGEKLYFHGLADSEYVPFAYAMQNDPDVDTSINNKNVRICYKTPEPAEYTIILNEMNGLPTLIDYPLYSDLDPEIRNIYERGMNGNVSGNDPSGNNAPFGTLNNEQQAKLDATLYLDIPAAVESIDIKSFLENDSNNTNQKNWIYIDEASTSNFTTVNGNNSKKDVFGDDELKINNSKVSGMYEDGYTAGLFSGYQDDKLPLIAYGNNQYPNYQVDVKGNDWILAVNMPGVKSIPDYAFDSCERLQSVIIGDGCEKIGDSPFQGCTSLTTIGTNNNPNYIFDNKILYENKDDGTLEINTCLPSRGANGDPAEVYVETENDPLLKDVTSIKKSAFIGCEYIKKANLSDTNIDEVPERCFYGCTSLSDVTLPGTNPSINKEAFDNGAPSLDLTIPCDAGIDSNAFDKDAFVTIWTYPDYKITEKQGKNAGANIKYLTTRHIITFRNDDYSDIIEQYFVSDGESGHLPKDPMPKLPENANKVFDKWYWANGIVDGILNVTEDRTAQALYKDLASSPNPNASPTPSPNSSASPSRSPKASTSPSASPNANASASPSASPSNNPANGNGGNSASQNGTAYNVIVENGAGSGKYQPGQVVTITAYAPESGKEFDKWTTSNADIGFSNNTAVSTTFIMPTHDVKVTATYKTAGTNNNQNGTNNNNNNSVSGNQGNNNQNGNNNGGNGNSGNKGNGTDVTVTTEAIDNNHKNLVSATVAGSTDNFVVKITDSAAAYAAVENALKNAYGNDLSNIKFVGFDISLYDESGQRKIENYDGLAVTITIPIPDDLVSYAGNNQACAVINGVLDDKTTKFTTIDGVPCMTFTATHFSPYGVYVNTNTLTAGVTDATPKTGDISPKWFLAIGLASLGGVMFLWKDKKRVSVAK